MHRCFEIPELVANICSHCDVRSLAVLGRTASLFECALDALWSGYHGELDGLGVRDLLHCFPPDICDPAADGLVLLSELIEPRHWDRFNFYAKRIRYFVLGPSRYPPFLSTLGSSEPPGGLLPNLRRLALRDGPNDLIHSHRLLSPKLRTLEICDFSYRRSSGLWASMLPSFFDKLPSICPDLTGLHLLIPWSNLFSALHTLFNVHRHIRRLEILGSADLLPLICTLPKLTDLSFLDVDESTAGLPSGLAFTSHTLKDLSFHASVEIILDFFGSLPKCPLESLSMYIANLGNSTELSEIVRVVTDKCQTQTLRTLDISQLSGSPIDQLGDHFIPFLNFPNITYFRCYFSSGLDDDFTSNLAAKWPKLVSLETEVVRF